MNRLYGELRYADSHLTFIQRQDDFHVMWVRNGFTHKSESFKDFQRAGQQFTRWVKQVLTEATVAIVQYGGINC